MDVPRRFESAAEFSRRRLLSIGGAGVLGASLARLLKGEGTARSSRSARARSVVFLYQFGGPSHVDTFDMKPDAPDGIRSHYQQIATSARGIEICERLPKTARVMDRVTLVRTVTTR